MDADDVNEVEAIRRKIGRPPARLLLGLDAAQLATIVELRRPSAAMARRWLSGRSDMGTLRLARLIRWAASVGRPESPGAIVEEVERRLLPPVPPALPDDPGRVE